MKNRINITNIKLIFFAGIGGIGMSGLAKFFNYEKKKVYGYDKNMSKISRDMEKEGIIISYEDDPDTIPIDFYRYNKNEVLIVYTAALNIETCDLLFYFHQKGYTLIKRAEVLGYLCDQKYTIAISGTHGKTTTSSMISHILTSSGLECSAFVGGIMGNYNNNWIYSNKNNLMVVEADEFDRSFLHINPDICVVTSIEIDHTDIYKDINDMYQTFQLFFNQIKPNGTLIRNENVKQKSDKNNLIYGNNGGDFLIQETWIENEFQYFNLNNKGKKIKIKLRVFGKHNIQNATAAYIVASLLKIDEQKILNGLETFIEVERRFEIIFSGKNIVYIDDYAHHPTALLYTINTAKEKYKGKKITGIFQPHLYSRTKDLMNEFAESLSLFDEIILMPIYNAREKPMEGISSEVLLDKIKNKNKKIMTKEQILNQLELDKIQVLITVGAGDISNLILPLKEKMSSNNL